MQKQKMNTYAIHIYVNVAERENCREIKLTASSIYHYIKFISL